MQVGSPFEKLRGLSPGNSLKEFHRTREGDRSRLRVCTNTSRVKTQIWNVFAGFIHLRGREVAAWGPRRLPVVAGVAAADPPAARRGMGPPRRPPPPRPRGSRGPAPPPAEEGRAKQGGGDGRHLHSPLTHEFLEAHPPKRITISTTRRESIGPTPPPTHRPMPWGQSTGGWRSAAGTHPRWGQGPGIQQSADSNRAEAGT